MKVYRKQMDDIHYGEIVAGDTEGWWRVLLADVRHDDTVVLTVRNTSTGEMGELRGNALDYRDVAA
ncbi:hypothetical protein GCM10010470_09180 [Saccharopolyspora taberi]|uniref:Uncharacterized protein n=1 Tax=Saccharopolyspora taberi TaxID=60895 RepID=A0ABN3V8A8_9PSEU